MDNRLKNTVEDKNNQYEVESFFKSNDEKMNRLVGKILIILLLDFPVMTVLSMMKLLDFSMDELLPIAVVVIALVISTWIFMYFGLHSSIQKYYTILVIAVIVFVMAQNASMTIFISFVIAIAFSCLYFDPVLTCFTVIVNYMFMIGAMALRSSEAASLSGFESANDWLTSYSSGLTLEYIAISAVFIILAINSRRHMLSEQQLLKDLHEEDQRYRMALEGSQDIILEYDVVKDFIILYGSLTNPGESKLMPHVIGQFKMYMAEKMTGFSEDYHRFEDYLSDASDDKPVELRIMDKDAPGGVRWIHVEGRKLCENDKLVKIIGKLRDITAEKLHEEEILENSRRDKLTKLISKSFGRPLVEEYLFSREKGEIAAIGAVTIANFDKIVDQYGNVFASTVIEQAAELIKSKIRDDDIVYRLGDINFLVLLKASDANQAMEIFQSMCGGSNEVYSGESEDMTVVFDAGFVTTEISSHYPYLVKCAIKALMTAVDITGSTCLQYNDSMKDITKMQGGKSFTFGYDDDEHPFDDNGDIVSYCFKILEQTKDLKSAINLLLSRIGRYFDLCGVAVIETNHSLRKNTYLNYWSSKGDRKFPDDELMTQSMFDEFISSFGSDGVCENNSAYFEYINEGLRSSLAANMPSQLRCAIYDEGTIDGVIIFEKSDPAYVWDDRIRGELREVARVMSTHIIRAKAGNENEEKSLFISDMSNGIKKSLKDICELARAVQESSLSQKAREDVEKISEVSEELLSMLKD